MSLITVEYARQILKRGGMVLDNFTDADIQCTLDDATDFVIQDSEVKKPDPTNPNVRFATFYRFLMLLEGTPGIKDSKKIVSFGDSGFHVSYAHNPDKNDPTQPYTNAERYEWFLEKIMANPFGFALSNPIEGELHGDPYFVSDPVYYEDMTGDEPYGYGYEQ